ncbi:MAG: hypothetical protein BGO10_06840 [Chlamydia sp. 32-24]|nr:MAG: hypothetical protein BGO10_06840 [Chlamydia sp. 32-24]
MNAIRNFFSLFFISFFLCHPPLQAVIQGELFFSKDVQPKQKLQSSITLSNDQAIPKEIHLKLVDYSYNANGETFFLKPGTLTRSNAAWIKLQKDHVILPPHSTQEIFYTIHVPNDPLLQGTYWSLILVEPQINALPTPNEQLNLLVQVRYGFQILCHIGQGIGKLKFIKKELQTRENKSFITFDVHNSGEIYLKPKIILKIFDEQGKLFKTFSTNEEKIYPETSVRYSIELKGLPSNTYTAFSILDAGKKQIFTEQFKLQVP